MRNTGLQEREPRIVKDLRVAARSPAVLWCVEPTKADELRVGCHCNRHSDIEVPRMLHDAGLESGSVPFGPLDPETPASLGSASGIERSDASGVRQ
jgi:hypothetical protein